MYELAIEHPRDGATVSIHPDRRDAADALAAYSCHVDCVEHIVQMTNTFSSYELVHAYDRQPMAIATIEHCTAHQHFPDRHPTPGRHQTRTSTPSSTTHTAHDLGSRLRRERRTQLTQPEWD